VFEEAISAPGLDVSWPRATAARHTLMADLEALHRMASEIARSGLPCARSAVISRIAASNGESSSDGILRLATDSEPHQRSTPRPNGPAIKFEF
jgi:hypothetical protein